MEIHEEWGMEDGERKRRRMEAGRIWVSNPGPPGEEHRETASAGLLTHLDNLNVDTAAGQRVCKASIASMIF
jgi:hypothetical protein